MSKSRRLVLRTVLRAYSLRALFFVVSVVCVGLVVWRVSIRPFLLQAEAAVRLEDLGATCRLTPAGPSWLARLTGRDQFYEVVEVNLRDADVAQCVKQLIRFPKLETFHATYNFGDVEMMQLANCKDLRHLFLQRTQITDQGMQVLANFPRLRLIRLGRNLSDQGLRMLRDKRSLAYVDLRNTQITDEGLQHLSGLPNLHKVELDDRPITDRGLEALLALPKLDEISLAGCREISDEGFLRFATRRQLRKLNVSETRISDETLQALRASLPGCQIIFETRQ